ncbi:Protein of unknown function [Bacillus mycoides]|nr:Protein of unknown function [Bacillus mycoides]
MIGDVRGIA